MRHQALTGYMVRVRVMIFMMSMSLSKDGR